MLTFAIVIDKDLLAIIPNLIIAHTILHTKRNNPRLSLTSVSLETNPVSKVFTKDYQDIHTMLASLPVE